MAQGQARSFPSRAERILPGGIKFCLKTTATTLFGSLFTFRYIYGKASTYQGQIQSSVSDYF